jgi:transglutaminase-like putative cysteine protease
MPLEPERRMQIFLESSEFIDWDHPSVAAKAAELSRGSDGEIETARRCFEFVRDRIRHSWDFRMNPVTCKASEVLRHGTGYCFAKSHLLAALLRSNRISAGLCYQRLTIEEGKPPYCLHGLNAVHLQPYGWYRIDPRGNKPGVEAAFCPPVEKLAFPIRFSGEMDLPEIWSEPLPAVVRVLRENADFDKVFHHLPDIELLPAKGVRN